MPKTKVLNFYETQKMDPATVKFIVEKRFSLIPEQDRPDIEVFFKKLLDYVSDTTVKVWNGYRLAPWDDPEIGKYVYDKWEPKKGDILIASYPKTGTTWTREIVRHIIYRNSPKVLENTNLPMPMFDYLCWGPIERFEILDKFPLKRRVFAAHAPCPLLNLEKFKRAGVKIIYTIRNPKDQAVSFYNFHKSAHINGGSPLISSGLSEKEFYDEYLIGKITVHAKPGEGYLEHVRDWYKHKNDPNVMFLVYEDMKLDFSSQLKRICDFIGEDLNEKELDFVTSKVTFSSMKKTNTHLKTFNFFNKGVCGNWKSHLTEEQSKLVEKNVQKVLGHTDIKFKYEL